MRLVGGLEITKLVFEFCEVWKKTTTIYKGRHRICGRFMVGKPSRHTISDRNVAGIRGRFVGVFSVACLFLCKCIVSNQIAPYLPLIPCLMYLYV